MKRGTCQICGQTVDRWSSGVVMPHDADGKRCKGTGWASEETKRSAGVPAPVFLCNLHPQRRAR